ncbi:hypothetical protein TIFTF001_009704 [Ficus carica]|uniref:Uncharacterized protein n=1 Tax=Ficus carica TaxID=3494 RepID=A0AA88CZ66_FICCA|nr:hypothetical protein TIFTF001_009704 [Ficus carica]
MPNSWMAILGVHGLVDQEDLMVGCGLMDVEGCPWTTPLVWGGRPESFLIKSPRLSPRMLTRAHSERRKSSSKPIALNGEPSANPLPSLSLYENHHATSQIGGALMTEADSCCLLSLPFAMLYQDYFGPCHFCPHYAALDLDLAIKTRVWNEQKEKLEKELRSAQDSKSYRNDKLVDKEVDAEILQLIGYFSNTKDKEDEGRLDEVVEAMTR